MEKGRCKGLDFEEFPDNIACITFTRPPVPNSSPPAPTGGFYCRLGGFRPTCFTAWLCHSAAFSLDPLDIFRIYPQSGCLSCHGAPPEPSPPGPPGHPARVGPSSCAPHNFRHPPGGISLTAAFHNRRRCRSRGTNLIAVSGQRFLLMSAISLLNPIE